MATNPNIPSPDTIDPVAPPETPVSPSPTEAPVELPGEPGGPGEIEEPSPDYDNPDPALPETPPPSEVSS